MKPALTRMTGKISFSKLALLGLISLLSLEVYYELTEVAESDTGIWLLGPVLVPLMVFMMKCYDRDRARAKGKQISWGQIFKEMPADVFAWASAYFVWIFAATLILGSEGAFAKLPGWYWFCLAGGLIVVIQEIRVGRWRLTQDPGPKDPIRTLIKELDQLEREAAAAAASKQLGLDAPFRAEKNWQRISCPKCGRTLALQDPDAAAAPTKVPPCPDCHGPTSDPK